MRACFSVLIALVLASLGACTRAPQPAAEASHYHRLVTLAPNLTELVFAAGAGDTLVGVSAYSDYPAAALELPVIGDAFMIDQEQLAILNPDLLLVWKSGTPAHVVDELRSVGHQVEVIRSSSLDDVSNALRRIGSLTGREDTARSAIESYQQGIAAVAGKYSGLENIRVFYQVSRRPLFTINGDHYVSELITLCGGSNVFADLNDLAPTVDVESVVARNPEVFLASTDAGEDAFEEWDRWPHIAANRLQNRFLMPADAIGRATPRLVHAAQAVCDALQTARQTRAQ